MQISIENVAYELIRKAATVLPPDVARAIAKAREEEEDGSNAKMAFDAILENIGLSASNDAPMCQDTGWPTFYVHYPEGMSTRKMRREIETSVAKGVETALLRPNAVNPVTEKNSGNCVGVGIPTINFVETDGPEIKIELLLKGGGSENTSVQFSLPNRALSAGRDLDGVRKVVLQAVYDAQGKGCGPAILGIGIGGDRTWSYTTAKRQLFRTLDDVNPDPKLAELEKRIYDDSNSLGIGPMGFGGKSTVLGVKAGFAHRHPACFFVSVAYFCWASRRASAIVKQDGSYTITQ